MMKQFVHKKMCKLQILAFLVLLLVSSVTNSYAEEWAMPSVIDEAGYLSEEEQNELTERLDQLRDEYLMDVAVCIEDVMSGDNAQNTADDIFDYNDYGYGSGKDGILLYISKSPRNYHFTTHGKAMTVFNSNGLAYIERQVLPNLQEDDYTQALHAYADAAEELLVMASEGQVYNTSRTKTTDTIMVVLVIAIPLLLAFIITGGKVRKMHTAKQANYADRYIKKGSFQLSTSRDIFLYSTVTRTERPKSDSDSGNHTSSSGETHGGCGGSY